jgi:large subunit ribosomal protein L6
MKIENLTQSAEIPKGVTVSEKEGNFTFKGQKGEFSRNLFSRGISYKIENGKVLLSMQNTNKTGKTQINTMAAHLRNCFKGVTNGFVYKLAICSGHFPMTVSYAAGEVTIKNFIGETVPRKTHVPREVEVKVEGKDITVSGIDIEKVGIAASKIEKLGSRVGFDRRRFQDGIYIVEKDGVRM